MDSRNSDSRRTSSSGASGVKSKWIKAFRSLKLTSVGSSSRNDVSSEAITAARISAQLGVHAFQEYTYKKITACDVCREILRGHSRQGLKCKLCRMNVHSGACQENAPRCQPKPRLLRKQKSASELETKIALPQIEDEKSQHSDPVYQSLRAAAEARKCAQYVTDHYESGSGKHHVPQASSSSNEGSIPNINIISGPLHNGHADSTGSIHLAHEQPPPPPAIVQHRNSDDYRYYPPLIQQPPQSQNSHQQQQPYHRYNHGSAGFGNGGNHVDHSGQQHRPHIKQNTPALLTIAQQSHQAYSAPHSPQKKKLTLRMKSLSLDSPESAETLAKDKRPNFGAVPPPQFPTSINYEPMEMVTYKYKAPPISSPGMPKRFKLGMHGRMCSIESDTIADLSSSPCPSPKPQRLLPTNIFVVLYNFRSRHIDELNLRSGYLVTVIDTTDPDWWQGKSMGKVGYFPSQYVSKLFSGEKPLQVIHTVQVTDGEFTIKLLREQIVIQVADEMNGIIMVRTGTNDKIVPCPSKYLQEIPP